MNLVVLDHIKNAILLLLLVFAMAWIVIRGQKLTSAQRAVLLTGLATACVGVLADSIWHIHGLLVGSVAALSVLVECLFIVTQSGDWPRRYVRCVQIGFGLLAVSICITAIWHISHPWGERMPHMAAVHIGNAGVVLLIIAFGFLRPRGRPWDGMF